MKDLSLYIIELSNNAIRANATSLNISINEQYDQDCVSLSVVDNGDGISTDSLPSVTDAFYTTKTTQKVGLGLALLKQNTEEAKGTLDITSTLGEGTSVLASMTLSEYDCLPVGDVVASIMTLLSETPEVDFQLSHTIDLQKYVITSASLNQKLQSNGSDGEKRNLVLQEIASHVASIN